MTACTRGQQQSTKRFKYTILKSFFNFVRNNIDLTLKNPCDTPVLTKAFRASRGRQWTILEKDVVDEVIFRSENPRNRLILELMARGGMRIGEVLKLKVENVDDRKLFIQAPKSGRKMEVVFIPQKVADRLKEYIRIQGLEASQRVFKIHYTSAREMVRQAGKLVGVDLKPDISIGMERVGDLEGFAVKILMRRS